MREFRFWLTSFFFSVFIHFFIIAVLAFSAGVEPKLATKEIDVKVELLNIPPALKKPAISENLPEQPRQFVPAPQEDKPIVQNKPIVRPTAPVAETPAKIAESPIISPAAPAVSTDTAPGRPAATTGISTGNEPAATGTPKPQGGGKPDKKAYPTYAPVPQYPVDARTEKVEGKVYIRVLLDEKGKVQEAQVAKSSGSSSLDQAALSCLRKWKFAPSYRGGKPVADRIIVPVVFNMKQK